MDFLEQLNILLEQYNVPRASAIRLSDCEITAPYKLEKCNFHNLEEVSVCIFTMPYFVSNTTTNISHYAKSRDYHLFFSQLCNDIIPKLNLMFPSKKIFGFADSSPINERKASAVAGLGIIGENGLLITDKYSSYVFLGEFITDAPVNQTVRNNIEKCECCGLCRMVCPMMKVGVCLSSLTQKKGNLTPDEENIISEYGSAWGCDLCQEVCPHTKKAKRENTIYTDIEFFKLQRTEYLTEESVMNMSEEQFAERAYSWRKRQTILRNLNILGRKKGEEEKVDD